MDNFQIIFFLSTQKVEKSGGYVRYTILRWTKCVILYALTCAAVTHIVRVDLSNMCSQETGLR